MYIRMSRRLNKSLQKSCNAFGPFCVCLGGSVVAAILSVGIRQPRKCRGTGLGTFRSAWVRAGSLPRHTLVCGHRGDMSRLRLFFRLCESLIGADGAGEPAPAIVV